VVDLLEASLRRALPDSVAGAPEASRPAKAVGMVGQGAAG
jgi:hypothetical protein